MHVVVEAVRILRCLLGACECEGVSRVTLVRGLNLAVSGGARFPCLGGNLGFCLLLGLFGFQRVALNSHPASVHLLGRFRSPGDRAREDLRGKVVARRHIGPPYCSPA